jgi:two-component system osmolarity sensor histidine kinase EnvZ
LIADAIISTHMIELKLAKITATKLPTVGIKRVIENLIENALNYGSDTITISTAMVDKNRNILCCVRDFGKGIDQTQMEQMFTLFAQGDQAREKADPALA